MKTSNALLSALLVTLTASIPALAHADPWKDESGHGYGHRHKGGEYKEEYRDGPCKVERKWKGNGDYKEERKCKDRRGGYPPPGVVYYPQEPAVIIAPQVIIRP